MNIWCKKAVAILYFYLLAPIFRMIGKWDHAIRKDCLHTCMTGCEDCWSWRCRARTDGQTPYKKFRR